MDARTTVRTAAGCIAGAAALAAGSYAACAASTWASYGHATRSRNPEEADPLLDGFMPLYDVVERHHIAVAAPADVTLAAARDASLFDSRIARLIFRGREVAMGATEPVTLPHTGLLPAALSLGWGLLAEVPGREIVIGGYTKPWEADVRFQNLHPREFAAFAEPGYIKIAWTLRADPSGARRCIFRTETRAVATDVDARERFRRYWTLVSPGVALIRFAMLSPVRRDAERRFERAPAAVSS